MFNQINIQFFNALNGLAGNSTFLDKVMIILAEYLPFVFILFLIYWWFKYEQNRSAILFSGYAATLGVLLNFLIGLFYFHSRPFMDKLGKLLISHGNDSSFPSDHATFMLSIAFMLLYFRRTRKAGVILAALALVGGAARVYCGVHYPFDIIGSILVAAAVSGLVFLFRKKLERLNFSIIHLYNKLSKHEN